MEPKADDDLRDLVEESLELSRENNRLLKAMRRDALIGGIVKMVFWLVLVIASFYFSFKFLEPYLGALGGSEGGQSASWQEILDLYKSQLGQ